MNLHVCVSFSLTHTQTEINKMDRLSRLEATVARLEALVHTSLGTSSLQLPHLLPPCQATTPLPPPHPAQMVEAFTTPLPPSHPPTIPNRPPHPAQMVEATTTPLPPSHPPTIPNRPPHPAPTVETTTTPVPPPHPPTIPNRPPHPATTPNCPPHPAPTIEASLQPHPLDMRGRLPSSAINKSALSRVSDVVKDNADLLRNEGKMTTMAVVLAREAFFGKEVMLQCTTKGYGELPGLPLAELMQLKEEIRKLYPHFVTSQVQFEGKWVKISDALSQACKRMRRKAERKGTYI